MSEVPKAVFLSYASQDAEAAKRIAEALRAAGVEVWFDVEGGLETGDEWDAKIRRQIKECVLFLPVISANTQAREEGYFRIEWELAAQRALGIASGVAFILPIVIDDTREPAALVPDRFRSVQWTRARGGELSREARAKLVQLWSHRAGLAKHRAAAQAASAHPSPDPKPTTPSPAAGRRPQALVLGASVAVLALAAAGAVWWLSRPNPVPAVAPSAAVPSAAPAVAAVSPAREQARRALALVDALDGTREDYQLAEELVGRAKAADATDAEVCAIEAHVHLRFLQRGWDTADRRREAARVAAQRAIRLDPQNFEARFVQTGLLGSAGREGVERERQLRVLMAERPNDQRVLRALASVVSRQGRLEESAEIARRSAALPGGDPLALYDLSQGYWFEGRAREAEETIEAALAQRTFTGALLMNAWYKASLRGDVAAARRALERVDPVQMQEDRAAYFGFFTEMLARDADRAIAHLRAVPRDWLNDSWYRGPKGLLLGNAHALAGRREAAAAEWRAALDLVRQRLADQPKDPVLLRREIGLLARLGRTEEALSRFTLALEIGGVDLTGEAIVNPGHIDLLIVLGRHEEALRLIERFVRGNRNWAVEYSSASLRLDPTYDPLRAFPGFARIVAEVEARERSLATPAVAAPTGAAPPAAAPGKADDKSVAVLAFANLSEDKANEYFSDGISEELLNVLAKVPGLKVSARTSAFSFKGKDVPIPEIARQLGVAYVVEGSVRRAGDQVRIQAQLVKASDGFQVWNDTFTRSVRDAFAVQDEIAGLIAKALSLRMGVVTARADVPPEVYELYIRAREAWNLRTPAGYDQSEALLNRTLELAPRFAKAHAALADVWELRAEYRGEIGRHDQRDSAVALRIRRKVEEALALDPQCAEAYASLGLVSWNAWRPEEGERALRRAIELNPSYASAHQWLGRILLGLGRMDDALASLRRATEIDPLSRRILDNYAWGLVSAGRYDDALRYTSRALELQPDAQQARLVKAWALSGLGRRPEAAEIARPTPGNLVLNATMRSLILARVGEVAAAEAQMAAVPGDANTQLVGRCALGRHEEALRGLQPGSINFSDIDIVYFSPEIDPVRRDPRFRAALAQVGLIEAHDRAQEWRAQNRPSR